jgi:glycolate oxidase
LVYECDAYCVEKRLPDAVVLPETTEEVAAIVRLCNLYDVPIVARGAGTSLSGGTLAVGGGVMIVFSRMREIEEINVRDRYAVMQAGVVNLWLSNALAGTGFHYAPDPSSQGACTLGGNVSANSGGPHTLKYGVTTNHVLGVEVVTPNGEIVQFGGPVEETPGPDLVGLFVGSEGTLGMVTRIWVRLTRDPESHRTMLAIFDRLDDATTTVSSIIGAGIVPAALEMMDQSIMEAVEKAFGFGFPLDAEAVLIIEVDGLDAALDDQRDQIIELCNEHGAREVRLAETDEQRTQLWRSRKQAFGALGRLTTSFFTQDGMVPRTKLPQLFRRVVEIGEKYDIRIVNVFHAGDGNIHPIFLYDERDAGEVKRVHKASGEIMEECVSFGGSVTGEHGIGVEKISFMPKMFTEDDLETMRRVRNAFNPDNRVCPGKKLPTAGARAVIHKAS